MTYEQELKLYSETRTKRQREACGCVRVLQRQDGVDNWLVVESAPCGEHEADPRIACTWV